jgi:hypothetical protein
MPLGPSETQPPQRRRALKKVSMNLDISLADVATVSRCVCCSISWTTRKTAAQKLDHIQRCAKKHGYDGETIHILLKNEIALPNASSVGHSKASKAHSTSTTLLEDVVKPRSNKRKVYPINHLSVGPPLRDAILSRAKDIIAGPSPDEALSQPLAGREIASDFLVVQAFTASTLIQDSSKKTLFSATSQDDEYFPELRDEALDTQTSMGPIPIG